MVWCLGVSGIWRPRQTYWFSVSKRSLGRENRGKHEGMFKSFGQIPGLYVSGTPQKSQFLLEDVEDHIPPWHPMATKLLNSPVYRGLGPMGQAWRPEGPRDPPHWGHDAWSQVGCRACLRMVSENQWIGFRVLVFLDLWIGIEERGSWLGSMTQWIHWRHLLNTSRVEKPFPLLWVLDFGAPKIGRGLGIFSGLLDQQMIPKVGLIQYNPFPEYSIPQYSSPGFMIEFYFMFGSHIGSTIREKGLRKSGDWTGSDGWSLRRYILAIEEILVAGWGVWGP